MDSRKKQILHAVIKDYVDTAEPVGSRTIAKKYDLGISPATIRNELSDLEDMGFIHQPHTSAGRIPSDKGYRYYVDCLMEPDEKELSKKEKDEVSAYFFSQVSEIDEVLKQSCLLLSQLTNYTAMVMKPKQRAGKLTSINLVQVDVGHVVLVLGTADGKMQHRLMELPAYISVEHLQEFEHLLQQRLTGLDLQEVTNSIMQEVTLQLLQHQQLLKQSIKLLESLLFGPGDPGKVLVNGALNLLSQPEFRDVDKVRDLLSALEMEDVVKNLLLTGNTDKAGTAVYIGDELLPQGVNSCSVISTPYYIAGENVGSIGVLGPTRMQYPKVIALVEHISQEVSNKIEEIDKNNKSG